MFSLVFLSGKNEIIFSFVFCSGNNGKYFFIFSVVKTESRFLLFFIRKRNESAFSFVFFLGKKRKNVCWKYICVFIKIFFSRGKSEIYVKVAVRKKSKGSC